MDTLELLLGTLDDLTDSELKTFQLYLTEGSLEGFKRIPRGKLQSGDRSDIAGIMREVHGNDGAMTVTLLILRKMKMSHNNLAEKMEKAIKMREEQRRKELLEEQLAWLNSGQPLTEACDLTLDPNTASRHVLLSEGNRKATWVEEEQPYPDHPDRFVGYTQVLSRESLIGRCYWECEWVGNDVTVGVAYKSMNRSKLFGTDDKSWYLKCISDKRRYVQSHNGLGGGGPTGHMSHRRVGVYLDRLSGTLSFYNVSPGARKHLYTFYTKFTNEPLYAAFRVDVSGSPMTLVKVT